MRDEPTESEELISRALAEAFENEGHSVSFPERDKNDKPDILIEIAGVRIACECTQIPPSYIYQFQHKKNKTTDWDGNSLLSSTWPNEPHQWVAEAIKKKIKLVPDYLSRTSSTEAWLVVHSPPQVTQSFIDECKEWILRALHHGAKMIDHPFGQIHLWTPKGGIHPISVLKNEQDTHSELGIDFSDGYPTLCVNRASIKFTTAEINATEPNIFNYSHTTRKSRIVVPIDQEYAKHKPAMRIANYYFEVVAWSDRAEINRAVEFPDIDERIALDPFKVDNLAPNKDYSMHYLHEFEAPKKLKTLHRVQFK